MSMRMIKKLTLTVFFWFFTNQVQSFQEVKVPLPIPSNQTIQPTIVSSQNSRSQEIERQNNQIQKEQEEKALNGDSESQYIVANRFVNSGDLESGIYWMEQSSLNGFSKATFQLWLLYSDEKGVWSKNKHIENPYRDIGKAILYLEKFIDQTPLLTPPQISHVLRIYNVYFYGMETFKIQKDLKKCLKYSLVMYSILLNSSLENYLPDLVNKNHVASGTTSKVTNHLNFPTEEMELFENLIKQACEKLWCFEIWEAEKLANKWLQDHEFAFSVSWP